MSNGALRSASASFLAFTSRLDSAQGVGLGLAPAFGHGFREIGEEHREPQPQSEWRG